MREQSHSVGLCHSLPEEPWLKWAVSLTECSVLGFEGCYGEELVWVDPGPTAHEETTTDACL